MILLKHKDRIRWQKKLLPKTQLLYSFLNSNYFFWGINQTVLGPPNLILRKCNDKHNFSLYAGLMLHVEYTDGSLTIMRINIHKLHVELMKEAEKTKRTVAEYFLRIHQLFSCLKVKQG